MALVSHPPTRGKWTTIPRAPRILLRSWSSNSAVKKSRTTVMPRGSITISSVGISIGLPARCSDSSCKCGVRRRCQLLQGGGTVATRCCTLSICLISSGSLLISFQSNHRYRRLSMLATCTRSLMHHEPHRHTHLPSGTLTCAGTSPIKLLHICRSCRFSRYVSATGKICRRLPFSCSEHSVSLQADGGPRQQSVKPSQLVTRPPTAPPSPHF